MAKSSAAPPRPLSPLDIDLRDLLSLLPGSIWTTDCDLQILFSYSGIMSRLNMRQDEYVGRTMYDVMQSNDPALVPIAAHLRAVRGERTEYYYEWKGIWFHTWIEPVKDPDGRVIGCLGLTMDASTHKHSEQELQQVNSDLRVRTDQQSQELLAASDRLEEKDQILRVTMASLADGVCAVDSQGQFVIFNRAAEALLRMGPTNSGTQAWSDHFGLFLPDRTTPYPPDQLPLVRAMRGETLRQEEVFVRTAQIPRGRLLDVSATPIVDDAGETSGAVAVFRDISQRKEMEETLRHKNAMLKQLIDMQDAERRIVSCELHDGIVQTMTGALMSLQALEGRCGQNVERTEEKVATAAANLKEAIAEARRLMMGLRPTMIDDLGIVAAVQHLANQTERFIPNVDFTHNVRPGRLAETVENALFRITQEALNNACRHSRATHVSIEMFDLLGNIRIKVQDNGVGFNPSEVPATRFGIAGIRERTRILGTQPAIDSEAGKGTMIVVDIPRVARDEG